jgi:hypothetical protein
LKKFETKTGLLTDYALSCGYIQVFEYNNKRVCLSKEHNCYHVKNTSNELRYWKTFDTLKEARQDFNKIKKERPQ